MDTRHPSNRPDGPTPPEQLSFDAAADPGRHPATGRKVTEYQQRVRQGAAARPRLAEEAARRRVEAAARARARRHTERPPLYLVAG